MAPSAAQPGRDYREIVKQKLVFGGNGETLCTYIHIFDDNALESIEAFTVSLEIATEDSAVVWYSIKNTNILIQEDITDGENTHTLHIEALFCPLPYMYSCTFYKIVWSLREHGKLKFTLDS